LACKDGYSALPAEDRRRLPGRMFAEKNYVLAAALFESVGEELSALGDSKLRYSRAHMHEGQVRLVNTASVLPILFRGYRGKTVADVLGVSFGDSASAAVDQLVQVVYQPSFDPEAALSLVRDDDQTVLSITAASVSLWRSAYLAWDPDFANRDRRVFSGFSGVWVGAPTWPTPFARYSPPSLRTSPSSSTFRTSDRWAAISIRASPPSSSGAVPPRGFDHQVQMTIFAPCLSVRPASSTRCRTHSPTSARCRDELSASRARRSYPAYQ
jgi:hypothetical protein